MKTTAINLGTRSSALAMWQAKQVEGRLKRAGYTVNIIPIESTGDIILDKPLHQMGMTGIFTKALDDALIAGEIDIAVHSLKDVPTQMPDGIGITACLKREDSYDALVQSFEHLDWRAPLSFLTGSLRRQSQIASRFPNVEFEDLRGNIATRLQKFEESEADGALFAFAALKRLGLKPRFVRLMDWMVPAPAQGVVGIACRLDDTRTSEALKAINDAEAFSASAAERQFLRAMMGGCTTPLGAHLKFNTNSAEFAYYIGLPNGTQYVEGKCSGSIDSVQSLIDSAIVEAKSKGADSIIQACGK